MRKALYLMVLLLAGVLLFPACGSGSENGEEDAQEPREEVLLTLEELVENDGTDDNPAYVAVDGIIYDVSDSPHWSSGNHHGNQAGRDLTDEIKNDSPHGVGNLERVPEIGRIIGD